MSVNNARRRRTGQAQVADIERRRADRVQGLIALRDRLAVSAAEYQAHDIYGAEEMFAAQFEAESAIRALAPRLYERRWIAWVERDSELAHVPDQPHPDCGVCKMIATSHVATPARSPIRAR